LDRFNFVDWPIPINGIEFYSVSKIENNAMTHLYLRGIIRGEDECCKRRKGAEIAGLADRPLGTIAARRIEALIRRTKQLRSEARREQRSRLSIARRTGKSRTDR
jgi:hypothetical protein